MRERKLEFGPISRGIYLALISVAAVVSIYFPEVFFYYVLALVFLGLGLRPLLERTGLYDLWVHAGSSINDRWNRKRLDKLRAVIDQKARDEKYRRSRVKDSRLPKNW